jgi:hypothetical protein
VIFIRVTVVRVMVALKEPFLGWRSNYEGRLKSSWTGGSAPLLYRGSQSAALSLNKTRTEGQVKLHRVMSIPKLDTKLRFRKMKTEQDPSCGIRAQEDQEGKVSAVWCKA